MKTSRFLVSDALWKHFERLLPKRVNTHPLGGGRPRRSDRDCFNAILFVLRTGCQWKALDATGICPGSTAHDRFQEWQEAGVFEKLWDLSLTEYDQLVGIDWSFLSMDGAMTKAPLGGEKNGKKPYGSRETRQQAKPAGGCGRSATIRRSRRRQCA